eukprot:Skav220203  [mRNA]  locus=scaffold2858:113729:130204:+ [translate_table: standard]
MVALPGPRQAWDDLEIFAGNSLGLAPDSLGLGGFSQDTHESRRSLEHERLSDAAMASRSAALRAVDADNVLKVFSDFNGDDGHSSHRKKPGAFCERFGGWLKSRGFEGIMVGEWTDEAQQRFEALLAKPLLNKAPTTLAIQDIQPEQSSASSSAPKAPVLALEGKSPSSSSSSSSSSSMESGDEGSEVNRLKAEMEKKMQDFEAIFDALRATRAELAEAQELIEGQDAEIAGLRQEIQVLRAQLEESDEEMTSD